MNEKRGWANKKINTYRIKISLIDETVTLSNP